jgi:hypothetical protein
MKPATDSDKNYRLLSKMIAMLCGFVSGFL